MGLEEQIGQFGYLEPLTKFFRIVFFYQTTQILGYYIYQFHNICECFFSLENIENMPTYLIFY